MDSLTPPPPEWTLTRCLIFRFAFVYFVLYLFPFPLDGLYIFGWLTGPYEKFWYWLVPWFAKHILHLPYDITVFPNGSGDTTFNYVQVLRYFVLAAALTFLCMKIDSRRHAPSRLHDWLRIYVRYALALVLLG